ncbi:hypothetical protein Y032_0100g3307 [Ancylostoma ceylanicum]|uniref:Uncharacterized protein n=1 Tax=Ancylostoma ceylanicum TaxID=53326 RepID=A0A016TIM8_9BILA|nr:hypothetical protein Y032_0100g3307 [Ancylostoma ceylanicum]
MSKKYCLILLTYFFIVLADGRLPTLISSIGYCAVVTTIHLVDLRTNAHWVDDADMTHVTRDVSVGILVIPFRIKDYR